MATKPTSVLITDRTISDITNRTAKGFNNFADVQRVQDWVNYFIDEVNPRLTKYTWSQYERVDKSKWETRILNNITELLKNYPDLSFTVPSAEAWDYQKQNAIENILFTMSNVEPIKEPVSFANDSWGTIISTVMQGNYKDYYHVGDTKNVTMQDGAIEQLKLYAFEDMELVNGGMCSMRIGNNITEKSYQYHSSSIVPTSARERISWSTSDMRLLVMPQIKNNLPEIIKKYIKKVKISTDYYYRSAGYTSDVGNHETTEDDVFIEGRGDSYATFLSPNLPKFEKIDGELKFLRHTYNAYMDGNFENIQVRASTDEGKTYIVTEQHKIRWFFCL